ncbi:MAG: hypothetical protein H7258_06555 [Ferruginibacter sp.]|nr:hypothetical protein [Ferruginibacter sp.]
MKILSEEDLLSYFKRLGNNFQNALGMQFGIEPLSGGIWTDFTLFNYDDGPLLFKIGTESDNPAEFMEGFQLNSTEQINLLSYNHSWMRYLNGEAIIEVTPMELEAAVSFKIVKRKTVIYSMDLHFYDEVYEHLTLPEDFMNYILKANRLLQAAVERRYK